MDMMQELHETFEALRQKLTFIEHRSMNDNMKPHEAVRQIMQVFDTFRPVGDAQWPLRQIRDILLD